MKSFLSGRIRSSPRTQLAREMSFQSACRYRAVVLSGGTAVESRHDNLPDYRIAEPSLRQPAPRPSGRTKAGADWIHITDLDGVSGENRNTGLVQSIITRVGTPVQMGGGFRSVHQIADWIDRGAGRIVVSTLAVLQPDVVKQAAQKFPDQIVVAVDVFRGNVMSHGWREESAIDPMEFVKSFADTPLAAIKHTGLGHSAGRGRKGTGDRTGHSPFARRSVTAEIRTRCVRRDGRARPVRQHT